MDRKVKKKDIEAILFVAKEPLTLQDFVKKTGEEERIILRWLFELENEYKDRGIIIKKVAGAFEMVTSPECAEVLETIVPKEYETLPRSAFETIAAIAYNQPVTRAQVGRIRGVSNPDYGLNIVLEKKLAKETEKGYITTDEFLKFFAINDLKELPEIFVDKSDLSAVQEVSEQTLETE